MFGSPIATDSPRKQFAARLQSARSRHIFHEEEDPADDTIMDLSKMMRPPPKLGELFDDDDDDNDNDGAKKNITEAVNNEEKKDDDDENNITEEAKNENNNDEDAQDITAEEDQTDMIITQTFADNNQTVPSAMVPRKRSISVEQLSDGLASPIKRRQIGSPSILSTPGSHSRRRSLLEPATPLRNILGRSSASPSLSASRPFTEEQSIGSDYGDRMISLHGAGQNGKRIAFVSAASQLNNTSFLVNILDEEYPQLYNSFTEEVSYCYGKDV